jgi:hypothetical protein
MERYIYTIERNVHESSHITGCNIASFDNLHLYSCIKIARITILLIWSITTPKTIPTTIFI